MSEVVFNEEPIYVPVRPVAAQGKEGKIMALIYKLGLATTQRDATLVLSGIIVTCIVLSITILLILHPHQKNTIELQRDVARFKQSNHAGPTTP